jgi:hypothetical protein
MFAPMLGRCDALLMTTGILLAHALRRRPTGRR